jgi:hypothetical protein
MARNGVGKIVYLVIRVIDSKDEESEVQYVE